MTTDVTVVAEQIKQGIPGITGSAVFLQFHLPARIKQGHEHECIYGNPFHCCCFLNLPQADRRRQKVVAAGAEVLDQPERNCLGGIGKHHVACRGIAQDDGTETQAGQGGFQLDFDFRQTAPPVNLALNQGILRQY